MNEAAPYATLTELVRARLRAESQPEERPALLVRASEAGSRFAPIAWRELLDQVARFATALVAQGATAGDRIVLQGAVTQRWIVADLAIAAIGAVATPIAAQYPPDQARRLIARVEPRLVVGPEGLARGDDASKRSKRIPWEDCLANDPLDVARLPAVNEDSLAAVLFTSGTSGEPRGVMLSQRAAIANATTASTAFASNHHETRLNILPFHHGYARTADLWTWLLRRSTLAIGATRETIWDDLLAVRPTLVNAVPYFYDRLWKRLRAAGTAERNDSAREALGGAIRALVCGGAGLPPEVEAWYERQGLPLLPGYGLTEAGPIVSMSTQRARQSGTVGRPLEGTDVRLADDGEVLVRGPSLMTGYWHDDAGTAMAFDEGWLRTGDLGAIDPAGFLRITGRKKDLIVLSTGRNVAPAAIEARLQADPFIAQAAVVGDGRSSLAALIVPEPDALRRFVREQRLWVFTRSMALRHRMVRELYQSRIAERLADLAPHEQVRRFSLLPRAFSLEDGELTPKLSLRRATIAQRFAREIDSLYAG